MFTPSAIKPGYDDLSASQKENATRKGLKELREYVIAKYRELPFIIDLHDTPPYVSVGEWYILLYPGPNSKLRNKLEHFRKKTVPQEKINISGMPTYYPSYNSLTVESWPVHYKDGKFETLRIEDEEKLVRKLVDFLQKRER